MLAIARLAKLLGQSLAFGRILGRYFRPSIG